MGPLDALQIGAGIVLLFVLPGLTVARAVFPERRFRGPSGLRGAVELFVMAFVLSVVLTVLVGYLLLTAAPSGFSAAWTSPTLEVALAAVALVAFGAGAVRGGWGRTIPPAAAPAPDAGLEGAWEVSQELDRIGAQRRALRAGRRAGAGGSEDDAALARLGDAEAAVASRREAEYER